MKEWIQQALDAGFDAASPCDVTTLVPRQDVREMCKADKCHAYNKNWTCPPHCGTLEECAARIQKYQHGILVQTIGYMTKAVDSKCYRETEKRHRENFCRIVKTVRQKFPDALCLGAGGCRICSKCAYPEPCRFPDAACSSMEAYGLFVTQICRDNQIPYYHGERTITYTSCILLS